MQQINLLFHTHLSSTPAPSKRQSINRSKCILPLFKTQKATFFFQDMHINREWIARRCFAVICYHGVNTDLGLFSFFFFFPNLNVHSIKTVPSIVCLNDRKMKFMVTKQTVESIEHLLGVAALEKGTH